MSEPQAFFEIEPPSIQVFLSCNTCAVQMVIIPYKQDQRKFLTGITFECPKCKHQTHIEYKTK